MQCTIISARKAISYLRGQPCWFTAGNPRRRCIPPFHRLTNSRLHNNNYPWVYAIILRQRLLSIAVLANGHRLEPDVMKPNYRNVYNERCKGDYSIIIRSKSKSRECSCFVSVWSDWAGIFVFVGCADGYPAVVAGVRSSWPVLFVRRQGRSILHPGSTRMLLIFYHCDHVYVYRALDFKIEVSVNRIYSRCKVIFSNPFTKFLIIAGGSKHNAPLWSLFLENDSVFCVR